MRISLMSAIVLVIAVSVPALCFDDYCDEEINFETTDYDISFQPDFDEERLTARCSITLRNKSTEPAREIPLMLYRLMHVDSLSADRPVEFSQTITPVTDWDKMHVNYTQVVLAEPVAPGISLRLNIYYSGYLHGYTETGMLYVKDRIDPSFSILRPDAFAYPVTGVPCWKAYRTNGKQEFDYRIEITVPDSLVAANGGRMVECVPATEGYSTYAYENIKPAWRIDVAIAPYSKISFGQNQIFHFPEDSLGARKVKEAFEESYDYFSNWWGPLRDSHGFAVIEIPDGWGSQTDITSIIQTASSFNDRERMYELYHEVSHLWNVDATEELPSRWEEGLAMFVQYLLVEELENRAILEDAAGRFIDHLRSQYASDSALVGIAMIDYGTAGVQHMSYRSGMIFFRLMYDMAGHEEFGRIVGSFFEKHRDSGASLKDFAHFCISENDKLDPLFQDWVFTSRYAEQIAGGADYGELLSRSSR